MRKVRKIKSSSNGKWYDKGYEGLEGMHIIVPSNVFSKKKQLLG